MEKNNEKALEKDNKETLEKRQEYNSTDPIYRRATFGVPYPRDNVKFDKADKADKFESKTELAQPQDQKRFVRNKRMSFLLDNVTFRKIIFERSEFHDQYGVRAAQVTSVSFEDCDFNSTFCGGTIYTRVVFRRCKFNRCDFMRAEFIECTFDNCLFTNCTAYGIRFNKTSISPQLFYKSIKVPEYNFSSLDQNERKEIKRDWIDVKLNLSRQLLASSSSVYNTEYIDYSSYLLKKAEFWKLTDKILNLNEYLKDHNDVKPGIFKKFWHYIISVFALLLNGINLIFTKGGTSLIRLIIIGGIIVLINSFHLLSLQVKYGLTELSCTSQEFFGCVNSFFQNIPYSISLFLGFGFSGFSFPQSDANAVVFYAVLGLLWYALLVQIIIRKVYK